MKFLIFLISSMFLVQGIPLKPPMGVEILDLFLASKAATDNLEGFPWMKAPKAKARLGTTPSSHIEQTTAAQVQPVVPPQNPPLALTNEMLQDYITSLTASLQPFIVPDAVNADNSPVAAEPPSKRPLKGKVPKQVDPSQVPATTDSYWVAERKMYPDSFYDEFYLDWLKKRQVEEEPSVATPAPAEEQPAQQVQPASPTAPPTQPLPSVPMTYNPYLMNPFMYPLAGLKVSKAMAQAQVNAALAAMSITTTPKPLKIKLKIPIPAGSDLAQVVSAGIAGFPPGTTYDLSKK